ncbi:hypothetical protein F4809DRAFT_638963 [Biscogniauxia mediterranea]|nr:hypothetical protein F4809DRAFT_638963 [Biscogniauxia mediterranea]
MQQRFPILRPILRWALRLSNMVDEGFKSFAQHEELTLEKAKRHIETTLLLPAGAETSAHHELSTTMWFLAHPVYAHWHLPTLESMSPDIADGAPGFHIDFESDTRITYTR